MIERSDGEDFYMLEVSVIVPVYKVEKYLDRCVASILSQTFPHFELILVDDGSPDQCGKICERWAKKDARVVVVHKENGMQGLTFAEGNGSVLWIPTIGFQKIVCSICMT